MIKYLTETEAQERRGIYEAEEEEEEPTREHRRVTFFSLFGQSD
jgi:hypothetical protein